MATDKIEWGVIFIRMGTGFSKKTKLETRIKESRWLDLSVDRIVIHKNSHHIEVRDTDKIECLL